MKDFNEYKNEMTEHDIIDNFNNLLVESNDVQIDEKQLNELVEKLVEKHTTDGVLDWDGLTVELTNEGIVGKVLGGLGGFALGKIVGKMVAKVLGIEKGILYDLFTSRLVGAAFGASLGKKLPF